VVIRAILTPGLGERRRRKICLKMWKNPNMAVDPSSSVKANQTETFDIKTKYVAF
jgi:hypothetical protein